MSIEPRHFIHPLGNTKRYSCWNKRCRKNTPNLIIENDMVSCLHNWCNATKSIEELERHPYFKEEL